MANCGFEPEIYLDDWSRALLAPLEGQRYPLSASIELTERCNLTCRHCFINQPAHAVAVQSREPSTEQWKGIMDQMAEAGCLFLLLTGGEPLLRPDFPELFVHARQLGMLVSLFTNGTMLTPELATLLAGFGLHGLEISLYGATQETYEQVTGVPGSYQRCMQGIEVALEQGLRLSLKSVLLTTNLHELEQMQALSDDLGVPFRYDTTIWPRKDGDLSPMRYQIPQEETLTLDLSDPKRREAWLETVQQFEGYRIRNEMVFTCGAGYRSYTIDAYGCMIPCTMVRQPAISLLVKPFLQAWEELGKIRQLKRKTNSKCETCDINALCVQCPGWSLAIHGDLETPVDFICSLSKKRAEMIMTDKYSNFPGGQ